VQTNISEYDAGMITPADIASNPVAVNLRKIIPVCGEFVPFRSPHGVVHPNGFVTAVSQVLPPSNGSATDVYVNSSPKGLKSLNQATILHEALHNLTGRYDDDTSPSGPGLESLLGLKLSDCPRGSICINQKLQSVNCVGAN
jgi:hypothetical protein